MISIDTAARGILSSLLDDLGHSTGQGSRDQESRAGFVKDPLPLGASLESSYQDPRDHDPS